MATPFPELLRPRNLEDVVGQTHLLGQSGPLKKLIDQGHLPSIIFWGPPGVGKTTLAYILARTFDYPFIELSGVEFSIKELEKIKPAKASQGKETSVNMFAAGSQQNAGEDDKPTVVFVDEIHRLNKSQQAQFLPYVERGRWILIGATTENPSFEVISPLLSRSQVLVLKQLLPDELSEILSRAIKKISSQTADFRLTKQVQEYLVQISNGDARLLLNALEAVHKMFPKGGVDVKQAKEALGQLHLVYDKHGEEHFDTISALHKSMRGSNPSASLYYLGRMLEAGEKPEYIARRCVRFAAEDIGNADPMALVLANAAFDAVHKLGMPESDVILSQLVIYLARAKKSNEAYVGYKRVQGDIKKFGNLPIPLKIRNAPTDLMKELGYGKDYKYAHDFSEEEMKNEEYLPEKLRGKKYVG